MNQRYRNVEYSVLFHFKIIPSGDNFDAVISVCIQHSSTTTYALTHCGPAKPYGVIDFGHLWLGANNDIIFIQENAFENVVCC